MQVRNKQCHDSSAACSSPPEEFWQVRPPGGIKHKSTSPLHLFQFVACTESLQALAWNVQAAADIVESSAAAVLKPRWSRAGRLRALPAMSLQQAVLLEAGTCC